MITALTTDADHTALTVTLDGLYAKTGAFKRISTDHHDPVSLMVHCEALVKAANAPTGARMNGEHVDIGTLNRILEAVEREV